jgi:hypothetical protein
MSGDYKFELESAFSGATGNRDWHARVVSPRLEAFKEMDLRVELRGENTLRFAPYAIKCGIGADGRWFSFNFKDGAETPFDGSGEEITLFCTLIYEVEK